MCICLCKIVHMFTRDSWKISKKAGMKMVVVTSSLLARWISSVEDRDFLSAHRDEITAPETQDLKETLLPYISI